MKIAETRRGVAVVFLVALAVWWLEALALPLAQGRDLETYLGGYIQLFQSHPIDLGYVLGRTPGSTLIIGGLLQFAGGALAEPVVSLLYAGSIVAWFLTARFFSVRAALLTALVLLLYPGYAILFHELSSDAIFGAAFAGWSLLVVRALLSPSAQRFAWAGAGVGLLALIRPGNQVLLVLGLLPLLLRASWRTRLISTGAFVLPAVVLLGGWAIHNGLRYDNYTVARGGNATVPFFRTFVTDKLVRPSNGPASRELARVVEHDLLPKEPYRSYGITLDEFFSKASPRMQVDLLALSDRHKGWHSNYSWLRDVGMEAVRAHPARYARGVGGASPACCACRSTAKWLRAVRPLRERRSTSGVSCYRCRPKASRSPPRTREASRRLTEASTPCGPPRPNITSSSSIPAQSSGTTHCTGGWTSWRKTCPTDAGARGSLAGSTTSPAGFRRPCSGSPWLLSPSSGAGRSGCCRSPSLRLRRCS